MALLARTSRARCRLRGLQAFLWRRLPELTYRRATSEMPRKSRDEAESMSAERFGLLTIRRALPLTGDGVI